MWRMNFDYADAEPQNLLGVGHDVGGVPRMQAAAEQQSLGIRLYIVGNELGHPVGEANHFGCNVVDQGCTVDAAGVEVLQECLGRATEFRNLIEVGPLPFHQFQRLGLEHLDRLDVDVAVGDHQWPVTASSGRIADALVGWRCREHCAPGEYAEHLP